MVTIDIETNREDLAGLLAKVKRGEEILIQEAGSPAYTIAAVKPLIGLKKGPIILGSAQGKFHVPDDFDTMFANEIADMFEGIEPGGPAR